MDHGQSTTAESWQDTGSAASAWRLLQIPISMQPGIASVHPVSNLRDLGFHVNADVTLTTYVAGNVRACFSILRQR